MDLPKCFFSGSYIQLFAKLLVSLLFLAYLVKSTPFNSERLDALVCTSQFCTLATLFLTIMMKIGFFEAEGVPELLFNNLLMGFMFLPLIVAIGIIVLAFYEGLAAKCEITVWSMVLKMRRFRRYLASP